MNSTLNNSKKSSNWGERIRLSPEQIVQWLESYRELMTEIWNKNPELRKQWEKINQPSEINRLTNSQSARTE